MISRQAVLEYLSKNPNHTTWQMRLHFLKASQLVDRSSVSEHDRSSVSIGSIANQLNYILRDLEAIGTIVPRAAALRLTQPSYHTEYSSSDR